MFKAMILSLFIISGLSFSQVPKSVYSQIPFPDWMMMCPAVLTVKEIKKLGDPDFYTLLFFYHVCLKKSGGAAPCVVNFKIFYDRAGKDRYKFSCAPMLKPEVKPQPKAKEI
jgi:hypothetical protein